MDSRYASLESTVTQVHLDEEAKPIWHDSDDYEEVVVQEEPEWLKKRRQAVKEGRQDSVEFGGKLTRLKPSKSKSGIRFKITKQAGHKEPIALSHGIKSLVFDKDGRHLAAIASGVKLYTVDESKSGAKFVLKNQVVDVKFQDYKIASLAFNEHDKGILMIGKGKKLLNYDIHKE
ncbi:hypothetical protein BEWA_026610 [Theileria equi strain WA]|uniref:Uncharacterized protein n=1 Tax=Theileria equi strain WA TaxID=1537102 RepID=L0AW32_THEEQ|nr:hypothetical protein BEWA_026610 [Theileria equi strain WA]AFZ79812.1 hypothetical protein BEWA_026610 [Theileria equi strain WA]|eukprot:XP_004829478.1 hypothetical protein BEWA_026610 [Theileria equi strain WA]